MTGEMNAPESPLVGLSVFIGGNLIGD